MSSRSGIEDIVRHFTSDSARFSPGDDPRLCKATSAALKAMGEGDPVEYPNSESSREECVEWWKTMGPIFAEHVLAPWAGAIPDEIQASVEKTDVKHEGIPVRILKKTSAPKDIPVVVYFHGGGFAVWSIFDQAYDNYLTRLAALGECIVVAVDFTLVTEQPFPASLDDCFKVTKWVVEGGASSHGVPAGKVLAAGDSAGANLAFGVSLKAKREQLDLVSGLYYICPYFDGETKSPIYPSMMEFDGYFASEGFLIAVCNGVVDDKKKWSKNPILWPIHATDEDLKGLPPSRTVVMQLDMIRDIGIAFHYKMLQAGIDSSLSIVSGGVHEQQLFTTHSPQTTDESIHDLARFVKFVSSK